MRVGVVVFPGSNCDRDALHAASLAGAEAVPLWHEAPDIGRCSGRLCGEPDTRGTAADQQRARVIGHGRASPSLFLR